MIPYSEFNYSEKVKPVLGKHPFSLTLEQLSFLVLISDKLNLNEEELKLVEYLTYNECRAVSLNRFRELHYEIVAFAAVLYVFDIENKDYNVILTLIDSMFPELYAAGSIKSKVYNIYNEFCNTYRNVKLDPDLYNGKRGALKLKQ